MACEKRLNPEKASLTERRFHRRTFLKGMVAGGVALSTGGIIAEKIVSTVGAVNPQRAYLRDVMAGDRVLMEREYVLMSDEEQRRLIAFFEENYRRALKE